MTRPVLMIIWVAGRAFVLAVMVPEPVPPTARVLDLAPSAVRAVPSRP